MRSQRNTDKPTPPKPSKDTRSRQRPYSDWTDIFRGSNQLFSSKRVIALIAFIMFVISYGIDLFSTLTVSPGLIDAIVWIILGGLGITGFEKFASQRERDNNDYDRSGRYRNSTRGRGYSRRRDSDDHDSTEQERDDLP